MTKVSRALFRSLLACLAVVLTVDGTQAWVIHTLCPRALALFILCLGKVSTQSHCDFEVPGIWERRGAYQCLGVFHMDHTHALNFLGGEKTKLNLLDGAQWRLGEREENVRHRDVIRCESTSGSGIDELGRTSADLGITKDLGSSKRGN